MFRYKDRKGDKKHDFLKSCRTFTRDYKLNKYVSLATSTGRTELKGDFCTVLQNNSFYCEAFKESFKV